MEEKYVVHLYRFQVDTIDRRDGTEESKVMTLPYPVEPPEDLGDSEKAIMAELGKLGYTVKIGSIKYLGQQRLEIDVPRVYDMLEKAGIEEAEGRLQKDAE